MKMRMLGFVGLVGLIAWSAVALLELWLVPLVVGGWVLLAGYLISRAFYRA